MIRPDVYIRFEMVFTSRCDEILDNYISVIHILLLLQYVFFYWLDSRIDFRPRPQLNLVMLTFIYT